MIHADTEGLLDRCRCGAFAGWDMGSPTQLKRVQWKACCTECCEQTAYHVYQSDAILDWNLARRAEKAKVTK